jgi:hypothetical protein
MPVTIRKTTCEVFRDLQVRIAQWVTKPRRWLSWLSTASTPIQDGIIRLFQVSSR